MIFTHLSFLKLMYLIYLKQALHKTIQTNSSVLKLYQKFSLGLFTGDPYGNGCKQVNCLENDDCAYDKYCDRLSYTCMNVCKTGICGDEAVCTVENHRYVLILIQDFTARWRLPEV